MSRRAIVLLVATPLYFAVNVMMANFLLFVILVPEDAWRNPLSFLPDLFDEPEWLLFTGSVTFVLVAMQAIFLIPVVRRRPPVGERPRSLLVSLFIGTLLIALITAGAFAAGAELIASLITGQFSRSPWQDGGDFGDQPSLVSAMAAVFFGSWLIWSIVLFVFSRDIWADRQLGRLVGLVLGGTIIELIVVIPIDVMVRRRTDCYCNTGSFVALMASGLAVLWLAGPGLYFALTSTRRRLWREAYCGRCGHEKGPSPGERCPECGFQWRE